MFFPGMHNIWMQGVWKAKLPLKIKIFLWQVCDNKVQSAEQLRKRNWPGDLDCKMCGRPETTDHIIFRCTMAQFIWCVCRDGFGWPCSPVSVCDWQEHFIEGKNREESDSLFFSFCLDVLLGAPG
jgi:hypothetical protein